MKDNTTLAATATHTTFYLCEKPSQARTLANILGAAKGPNKMHFGDGVVIGHAFGHMLNLAMPEEYIGKGPWCLDSLPIVPGKWIWKVKEEHREHFENIGKYLQKANTVVIATDPDEEGEVIGRQILLAHGYTGKVLRLWMSVLEPESLKIALKNLLPLSATDHFYHAGRVRHEMDWLFGMNLTRAFTLISKEKSHIGRVKTRLLNEIVHIEKQVESDTSSICNTAYVTLGDTVFELEQGDPPIDYIVDFKKLEGMQSGIYRGSVLSIFDDDDFPITPPLPYTLSSLLADVADLGIPLNEGYTAIQKLYESGAISYPRTSSTKMPGAEVKEFAAHHAIVTVMDGLPCGMTDEATRIFELIRLNELYQRNPCILKTRRQTFKFCGEEFSSYEGWMTIPDNSPDLDQQENRKILAKLKNKPAFEIGDEIQANVRLTRNSFSAFSYFTEASLLRMMAEKGIGTESTRVATIANLIKEKLIDVTPQSDHEGVPIKHARIIRSTQLGRDLIDRLPDAVTGQAMESQLQQALEDVRAGHSDESSHMMNTTRWLAQTIHDAV